MKKGVPFADKESNWGYKCHNAHHGRKVAGTGIHIQNTHLFLLFLHKKPSRGRDTAKNNDGEKLKKKKKYLELRNTRIPCTRSSVL